MSTIFGLMTKGNEIILATDTQATMDEKYKKRVRKLKVNKNQNIVFGVAGIWDEYYFELEKKIMADEIDMEKIIENKFFEEFLELNLNRWGGMEMNKNKNVMIFATNFNERQLFYCHPLGKIEEMHWTVIGSGGDFVRDYLNSKWIVQRIEKNKSLNYEFPSKKQAKKLAYHALSGAVDRDIYSSGMDFAIMRDSGINFLEKKIHEPSKNGEKRVLNSLLKL